MYLITRRADLAMVVFSILFFPGVLLHEGSHFLAARLVGVRTGRFSITPRPLPDGRLQLGYVETAQTDWLRDAVIGAAPLLAGGLAVAYIGIVQLGLLELWNQVQPTNLSSILSAFSGLVNQPDFWIWFYLLFTISSTMLPSASDRRAWLPLGFTAAILLAISLFAGAGPWLAENLAPLLNGLLGAIAVIFMISIFVHLFFLIPTLILRIFLSWVTGLRP